MVGIAIRKLNFEAVLLSKPKNSPVEIVIPDLEVPGIKDKDCAKPIMIASRNVMSFIFDFSGFLKVAMNKTTPNKIVVIAIIELVLRWESIKSTRINPSINVGSEDMTNCTKSWLFAGDLSFTKE